MDSFWFDTQQGYCEHYASAVTYILRAAGIPARVVLGYHGGRLNPISNAITLQQNDAHAWLEYWQSGVGWRQLDPTAFVASERIDRTIQNHENYVKQQGNLTIFTLSWERKIQFYLDSARYFTERWLLYYNPNSQQNLLQKIGLGGWNTGQLLQASVVCMMVFFMLIGFYYQWRQYRGTDALLHEYYLLQKQFRRFNVSTLPSVTLKEQCTSLIERVPLLRPILSSFLNSYEQLRLTQSNTDSKSNKKEAIKLFKTLRYALRRRKHFK